MTVRKVNVSDLEISGRLRKKGKKKKCALFDTPISERTYWGNDPGSNLLYLQVRSKISEAFEQGYLLDIKNDARRLNEEMKKELRKEQLLLIKVLIMEKIEEEYLVDLDQDEMFESLSEDEVEELWSFQQNLLDEIVENEGGEIEIFRNKFTNELMFEHITK